MSQIIHECTAVSPPPPHGLEQIIATFGDIFDYIRADQTLDPRWQADQLATVPLRFPLTLSWDHSRRVERITCHKLIVSILDKVFESILRAGLQSSIASFGGCYSFRLQRLGTRLSAHAWGIAIDLNPESNQQGTAGYMDQKIVELFADAGFVWGGGWQGRRRDPMHFQFCSGY